jgi:hypothetical protein
MRRHRLTVPGMGRSTDVRVSTVRVTAVPVPRMAGWAVSVPGTVSTKAGDSHRAKPHYAEEKTRDVQVHAICRDSARAQAMRARREIRRALRQG